MVSQVVFGDRFNYIEMWDVPGISGLKDRWSLKAVVSQDRFYCIQIFWLFFLILHCFSVFLANDKLGWSS